MGSARYGAAVLLDVRPQSLSVVRPLLVSAAYMDAASVRPWCVPHRPHKRMTETEDRLERIEKMLTARAQANPLEAIGKLLESELVQGVQEKAEQFETDVRTALKAIFAAQQRLESKVNILSGQLLSK